MLRSDEELASFSDFQTPTGPSTFGKSKKEFNIEIRNCSPGPGAYKSNDSVVKSKTPDVLFPKAGKRFEFNTRPDVPGPNQYYPSKRFISNPKSSN